MARNVVFFQDSYYDQRNRRLNTLHEIPQLELPTKIFRCCRHSFYDNGDVMLEMSNFPIVLNADFFNNSVTPTKATTEILFTTYRFHWGFGSYMLQMHQSPEKDFLYALKILMERDYKFLKIEIIQHTETGCIYLPAKMIFPYHQKVEVDAKKYSPELYDTVDYNGHMILKKSQYETVIITPEIIRLWLKNCPY